MDLKRGATRIGVLDEYNLWTQATHVHHAAQESESVAVSELIDTYETETGFFWDTANTGVRFKTAVVVGREVYVANIKYTNKDGQEVVKNDAMINSPVDKLDTFPFEEGYVSSASINDGDEIVKLEEYNDRILQFKKNKLHIINIAGEIQELESTYKYKGVTHPACVAKTDDGIVWANKYGVFLYNGESIIDLFVKENKRKITIQNDNQFIYSWEDFLTADKNLDGSGTDTQLTPMVGYSPKDKKIVIADDISTGSTTDPRIILYDFITQSWTYGSQNSSTRNFDVLKTNFINDYDGNLMFMHTTGTSVALKWSDESIASTAGGDMLIVTKDIDFGSPGIRKKIYKVYITYNGGTDLDIDVRIRANTDTSWTQMDANLTQTSDNWHIAELKPVSTINNVKSVRLYINDEPSGGNNCPATFKINDISIVYREKNIK